MSDSSMLKDVPGRQVQRLQVGRQAGHLQGRLGARRLKACFKRARPYTRTTGRIVPPCASLGVEPLAAEPFRKNCPFQGPRRHFLRQNETLRTLSEASQRARSTWRRSISIYELIQRQNATTKHNARTPEQQRQRRGGNGSGGAGGRGVEGRPRAGDRCGGWQEVGGAIAGGGGGVRRWRQKLRRRRQRRRRRRRRR